MQSTLTTNAGYLTDEEYDLAYSLAPRLCVDVILYSPGRGIVLSRRAIEPQLGMWHIPGGRVRHQETLKDAALRLIKKEVGVSYDDLEPLGVMEFLHEKMLPTGRMVHSVSVAYISSITQGEPRACDEGEEIGFFTELPKKENTDPVHHAFIAKHWQTIKNKANF